MICKPRVIPEEVCGAAEMLYLSEMLDELFGATWTWEGIPRPFRLFCRLMFVSRIECKQAVGLALGILRDSTELKAMIL